MAVFGSFVFLLWFERGRRRRSTVVVFSGDGVLSCPLYHLFLSVIVFLFVFVGSSGLCSSPVPTVFCSRSSWSSHQRFVVVVGVLPEG
jgi:hypothetical protein